MCVHVSVKCSRKFQFLFLEFWNPTKRDLNRMKAKYLKVNPIKLENLDWTLRRCKYSIDYAHTLIINTTLKLVLIRLVFCLKTHSEGWLQTKIRKLGRIKYTKRVCQIPLNVVYYYYIKSLIRIAKNKSFVNSQFISITI